MHYDVLLLHPPSLYDFRKMPLFPGPSARLVKTSTPVLINIPIGLMSMAEYLDRQGFKVKIINLAESMFSDPFFDVEYFLNNIDASLLGIDLHWCNHSQGAIEISRMCKRIHPDSMVILGGLTATCFANEIVKNFTFIDAIIRGEAEKAIVKLAESIENGQTFEAPNLTYLENGKISTNKDLKVVGDLDDFDFTRFDLLEPQKLMTTTETRNGPWRSWWIPTCRGCLYDCVSCGGSAYSYNKLFKRTRPAFRSPKKVAEDLQKLSENGFDDVFLFGDIRMGGEKYWRSLLEDLHKEKSGIKHICMELFSPADSEFLSTVSKLRPAENLTFTLSPESGVEAIRKNHGRNYSNSDILHTAELCSENKFGLSIFFMLGLSKENKKTIDRTFELWNDIILIDEIRKNRLSIIPDWGQMILLDPGSLAFDYPEKYGYKLSFSRFYDYYRALSIPSWIEWISYVTDFFTLETSIDMSLYSLKKRLDIMIQHGLYESDYGEQLKKYIKREILITEKLKIIKMEQNNERKIQLLKELEDSIKNGTFRSSSKILDMLKRIGF